MTSIAMSNIDNQNRDATAIASMQGAIAGSEHVSADPHGIEGFAAGQEGAFLPCAISISSFDNPCVLRIHGSLDFSTEPFLRERIHKAVESLDAQDLTIDLSYCQAVDAAGLGLLVGTNNELRQTGYRLRLTRPCPRVKRVLDVTRVGDALGVMQ